MARLSTWAFGGRYGRDRLPGGLADEGFPAGADPEQIAKGLAVEMEHTDDEELALEIVADHLTEDPRYYDKLERVEGRSGRAEFRAAASAALDKRLSKARRVLGNLGV